MNYIETIKIGTDILKVAKVKNPVLDAELLLSKVLKTKREDVLVNSDKKIKEKEFKNFIGLINKRKYKMPVAQIIGKKYFWKKSFLVNKKVLIPRPETEIIVESALKIIHKNMQKTILDIGTGSGCIIVSILHERKSCRGIAIDKSKEAIDIAKTNAKMQHIENRIKFINSDIDKISLNKYDLIVSNPPYIKKSKIISLEEDVKRYEPLLAIDGGHNGYELFKKVISRSSKWLKKKGKLILEIDKDQTRVLKNMLLKYKFYKIQVIKDLSNNERCIIAEK